MTQDDIRLLARNTLRDPGLALRQLRSLDLPMSARWMGLLLAVTLSSILAVLAAQLFPVTVETGLNTLTRQPFTMAGLQLVGMTLAAWLIAVVGRAFGGVGSFEDALLIVVWIEFLLLGVQLVQVVLMLIFPALATLLGVAAMALFLWLAVMLTKELHGFRSAGLVLVGMFATAMLAGIALSVVLAALGLVPAVPA